MKKSQNTRLFVVRKILRDQKFSDTPGPFFIKVLWIQSLLHVKGFVFLFS